MNLLNDLFFGLGTLVSVAGFFVFLFWSEIKELMD